MPVKMFMHISSPSSPPPPPLMSKTVQGTQRSVMRGTDTLKQSIIGRIHNIQPGCGSCGRK